MSRIFFDANIIVYANDRRIPDKQDIARRCLDKAVRTRTATISTQVMKEFASVALGKLKLSISDIQKELHVLERGLQIIPVTPAIIRRGLDIHGRYGINFWDGLIIAAAREAQCEIVLSEDLNDGQMYDGVRVTNPFKNT